MEIKRLLRDGKLTQQAIAHQFNVNFRTIHAIKTGKLWAHVETPEVA